MTLKECYLILGVESSTMLEDVKRAYRRRAFELHPDLNPHLADAGRQFQQLNEAYVILSRLIAAREAREERLKAKPGFRPPPESAPREPDPGPPPSGAPPESRDEEKTEQREQTAGTASGRAAPGSAASGPQARQEKARQEEHAGVSSSASKGPWDSSSSSDSSPGFGTDFAHSAADRGQTERERTARPASENLYTEQQEVLRDILNDPFARRVFEDIYSEIRKKGAPGSGPIRKAPPAKPRKSFSDILSLSWGQHKSNVDFSHGVGCAVKDWLRNQIDEEQTFHLPAARLFPGARIRLQIRHGLSDNVTTVEVTLPPDFAVGKPIRLKGMGKKLGRWQGDLYLRLMAGN